MNWGTVVARLGRAVRDAVTETGDEVLFGDRRFVRDTIAWPKALWFSETYDPHGMHRPRVHVCGLWGYCKYVAATPPSIGIMGPWPMVMIWLPHGRRSGQFVDRERDLSFRMRVQPDRHEWNWRTPVAKAVYWVGGMLSKVKYPQPSYTVRWDEWNEYDYDDPPWRMVKNPRRSWQSVGWAWDLLGLSERIDPVHWEHWAIDHDAPTLDGSVCAACPECGGGTCEDHVSPVTPDSVTGNACTHPDAWFDRVLCEEPCGTMHMICTECGRPTDPCAHVTGNG